MQNHYKLLYREEEREMFPTLKVTPSQLLFSFFSRCQLLGVGPIPWSISLEVFLLALWLITTKPSAELQIGKSHSSPASEPRHMRVL
jgi:hypothetical protein